MSQVLVFLQHDKGSLLKASLVATTAAMQIKDVHGAGGISAVCLGPDAKAAAGQAATLGYDSVYTCEASELENYRPIAYTQAVLAAAEASSASILVAASTTVGKDFMARVSAALEAGQASDITKVNDDKSFKRPMYAGNAFADVEVLTDKKVVTVRGTAFDPASETGGSGEVKDLTVSFNLEKEGEFIGVEKAESERPELSDAEVVVSGGRALQSEENFQKYIFPLADALGAAVGASRAAVDSGYAPNDWQVGQTGKVVAPNLYVAVGISGAIQHLAGMKDSKVIVAINKDEEAPIFDVADYGLVADLYEVIEPLTDGIKAAKS